MSKDFEEKVLKKLDELDEKVSRIDAIEEKISCIDEIKEKVSRIDAIEEKISCIDEIKEKVSKIDEIEKIALANGRKIDHLDYRVGRIEDRKRIDSLEKQDFDYAARISNLEFAIEKNSEQIKN